MQHSHELFMNIRPPEEFERTALSTDRITLRSGACVRAATLLNEDASTDVIDVNDFAKKSSSVIQYVEVANNNGRLYCLNGLINSACWIKIVTLAKDCQSCNVILMSTEKGVVLKTIRVISPGEPLLMWFTENILAMMKIPFLIPYINIQAENRYICHVCKNLYQYPNPLKIHLALKCNKLDCNNLWTTLVKEFTLIQPGPGLSINVYAPGVSGSCKLELSESLSVSSGGVSGVSSIVEKPLDTNKSTTNISPRSSNGPSPISSPAELSPVRRTVTQRNSAFLPYMRRSSSHIAHSNYTSHRIHFASQLNQFSRIHYNNNNNNNNNTNNNNELPLPLLPPPPLLSTLTDADAHAAQMETFYSNIGKSKQGHLCVYCGKIYSRKYGLKIHIRTHTGYKPLRCKVCLRPFGDPSNLNKHVRLHADGETPYRCGYCGKVLVRRRDLERHIKSRHQENAGHISDISSDGLDA
ncbi:zinc finger protein 816 [Diachasmimorpha longicaudata]|uniref:zinc finger protein 816 n=1 Tax=Diachasmimorpha longicaudata TaxID=58733 RepID=UPI0030B8B716